jgi:NADH dehydrogenase FAD-containing subunit
VLALETCDWPSDDCKDFFEISWAGLRAMVEPSLAPRVAWKHEVHLKGAAKLLVGTVARVTAEAVELADGTAVPYDYLVLAPGCGGGVGKPLETTLEARIKAFEADVARIKAASAVLVVGGGPTGVELAAEILTEFPGKKVTLVQSGPALVPQLEAKAQKLLLTELIRMGCVVLTGTKVTRTPSGALGALTDQGHDVAADVVFDCTGSKPHTAFCAAPGSHPGIKLDGDGFIVVNKELRVPDAANVFALGDAAATEDAKQGYLAVTNQVPTVVANLLAAVSEPKGAAKEAAVGPKGMMLVTLGRANGVAQFPGGYVVGGWWMSWLPTMIKSKGLFIDKVRGEHGV